VSKAKAAAKKPAVKAAKPTVEDIGAELNDKQRRFCEEYLVDLNATQAYLRAGYEVSEKTASTNSSRMLANAKVAAHIQALKKGRAERTGTDADMVVQQWREIAMANPNDLMEFRRGCCRFCWGKDFKYQRTPREMEAAREAFERQVAAKIEQAKKDGEDAFIPPPFDEEGGVGYNRTRAANKDCPECFGDGEGYAHFKDTRYLPAPALTLYGGVKVTREGIEIKVNSKEKALEMLARHNGMLIEKVEQTGKDGGPIEHKHNVTMTPDEAYRKMLEG